MAQPSQQQGVLLAPVSESNNQQRELRAVWERTVGSSQVSSKAYLGDCASLLGTTA